VFYISRYNEENQKKLPLKGPSPLMQGITSENEGDNEAE